MAPSSGTIPRLDELIKPFLLEGRSECHTFLLWATIAVVVGVAFEVWEIFHDVREEIDHNKGITRTRTLTLSGEGIPVIEHRRTWMKTFGAIGWIFVVLGVAGEFEFDSIISDFDNGIRLIDDSLLRQARSESADANIGAALATQEAARADARTLREIDARVALEKEFIWEGPRDKPILAAQRNIRTRLMEFRGQQFRNSECELDMSMGTPGTTSGDLIVTENAITLVLVHAGWSEIPSSPGMPAFIPRLILGCSANGVAVLTSPNATEQTRRAAIALDEILTEVLSEHRHPRASSTNLMPRAQELPPASPDTVEILIGRHLAHPFDLQ